MIDFKAKARAVHGNKFDYSKSVYTGRRNKITITCPIHGDFEQKAGNHLSGNGCHKCSLAANTEHCRKINRKALERSFADDARRVHGDKYDYSEVHYKGVNHDIRILCEKHGFFTQKAGSHLRGKGCKQCGLEVTASKNKKTFEEVCEKASKVHLSRYTYRSLVNGMLEIVCKEHGVFRQSLNHHIFRKRGCPKCGGGEVFDTDSFVKKALQVHKGEFDYSKAAYTDSLTPLTITCKKHGDFYQTPHVHLRLLKGAGCKKCQNESRGSSGEVELRNWLSGLTEVIPNAKDIIPPYEVDIWLPKYKVAVEYHGLYWHSERFREKRYHQLKWEKSVEAEVFLIQIFEDEWRDKKELVKSVITSKLGLSVNRVYARKCVIREVTAKVGRSFFEMNHLQGADSSSLYLGLYHGDVQVACLSLTIFNSAAKIQRFACLLGYSIPGSFSKLLKYFLRKHCNIRTIETYANLRYSSGNVYSACGFSRVGITEPGYFYSKMRVHPYRESRQKYQVHKLKKAGYSGTERSITEDLGLLRVYDAGHMRLRLVTNG